MGTILFLAFKDILRNKKILLLIILAIGAGITVSLPMQALFEGFAVYFQEVAIDVMAGHITISPKEDELYISNVDSVERKIELLPEVISVSPRLTSGVIITRRGERSPSFVIGVIPSKEKRTTTLADKITDGHFIKDGDDEIVLGSGLADTLKADVGKIVNVTFEGGEVRRYRVKGIMETGFPYMDEATAFIDKSELEDAMNLSNTANTIFVKLTDINLADKVKIDIMQAGVREEVKTWKEVVEFLEIMESEINFISGIISFLGLVAASVSVAIVMYINVERKIREIGILKAIGGRSLFVLKVFMAEVLIYAVIGIVVGNLFGLLLIQYFEMYPPIQVGAAVPMVLTMWAVISSAVSIFTATVLAGIYPAIVASRINIIDAIWKGV